MSHAVFKQYWRYLLFPGFVDDIPESSEVPEAPEPQEFGGSSAAMRAGHPRPLVDDGCKPEGRNRERGRQAGLEASADGGPAARVVPQGVPERQGC